MSKCLGTTRNNKKCKRSVRSGKYCSAHAYQEHQNLEIASMLQDFSNHVDSVVPIESEPAPTPNLHMNLS